MLLSTIYSDLFCGLCLGFEKEEDKVGRFELMIQARLNIALCHLKLGENINARDACSKVLELDPTSEKGLFRRGQVLY